MQCLRSGGSSLSAALRRSAPSSIPAAASLSLSSSSSLNAIASSALPSPFTASPAVNSRSHSTLPVIEHYVRRVYPFPTILESNLPPDYSPWLYYHQHYPHDLPTYKSKLSVDIRDLRLSNTARIVLREMVGRRFNPATHRITFTSRSLPSAQANENRVFQQLDACLEEATRIAAQIDAEKRSITLDAESGAIDEEEKKGKLVARAAAAAKAVPASTEDAKAGDEPASYTPSYSPDARLEKPNRQALLDEWSAADELLGAIPEYKEAKTEKEKDMAVLELKPEQLKKRASKKKTNNKKKAAATAAQTAATDTATTQQQTA